jgi:hypothetical protein
MEFRTTWNIVINSDARRSNNVGTDLPQPPLDIWTFTKSSLEVPNRNSLQHPTFKTSNVRMSGVQNLIHWPLFPKYSTTTTINHSIPPHHLPYSPKPNLSSYDVSPQPNSSQYAVHSYSTDIPPCRTGMHHYSHINNSSHPSTHTHTRTHTIKSATCRIFLEGHEMRRYVTGTYPPHIQCVVALAKVCSAYWSRSVQT